MTMHDAINITKLIYKAAAIGFAIYYFAKGNIDKMLLWTAISLAL